MKRNTRMVKMKEICTMLEIEEIIVRQLLAIIKRKKFGRYEPSLYSLCDRTTAFKCSELLKKKVKNEKEPQMVLLAISLLAASRTYDCYVDQNVPEQIFIDTMKCFPRFVKETYEKTGVITFDRFSWTWRQLSMQLYRLGTLEFELAKVPVRIQSLLPGAPTQALSVHIPSDARLTTKFIDDSFLQAKKFWSNEYIFYCDTWLLSPTLNELLPMESGIKCFYNKFHIIDTEDKNDSCYYWLFRKSTSTPLELLPEDTYLRSKVKDLFMQGGSIGTGLGISY